jgi:5-histidylcysteine sulfoxide synthase
MSWDDLSKNDMLWPPVSAVTAYRRRVYALVRALILTSPLVALPIPCGGPQQAQPDASAAWSLFLAFEHERIHVETSSVLIRELPLRLLARPPEWPGYHPSAVAPMGGAVASDPVEATHFPPAHMLQLPGRSVTLGKPRSWPSFGWDNEYGSKRLEVAPFTVSRAQVSNGEFYAFVTAGGYAQPELWSAEGWRWRAFRNAKWPPFWQPCGPQGLHHYQLRLTFDAVPMPWALPVVVNAHEAAAFAAWRTRVDAAAGHAPPGGAYRLPTEAEHHCLRDHVLCAPLEAGGADQAMLLGGAQLSAGGCANFGLAWGCEGAVDSGPQASSGAQGVGGGLWEWCLDEMAALPGFRVHPFYEDFSTPCFDGKHHLILGGSFASTGDLASRFARFHFRPHFVQHSGFRIAASEQPPTRSCTDAPPPYAAGWVPPSSAPRAAEQPVGLAAEQALATSLLCAFAQPSEALGQRMSPDAPLSATLRLGLRCAASVAAAAAQISLPRSTALVVGGAANGAAFALRDEHGFESVTATDHSREAIAAAESLNTAGAFDFYRPQSAERCRVVLPSARGAAASLVFRQADPGSLPAVFPSFACVMVCPGVLDGMPSPRSLLGRMGGPRGLVQPGGILATICAYGWREATTPKEAWLCAPGADSGAEGIRKALGAGFRLLGREEVLGLAGAQGREAVLRCHELCLFQRCV